MKVLFFLNLFTCLVVMDLYGIIVMDLVRNHCCMHAIIRFNAISYPPRSGLGRPFIGKTLHRNGQGREFKFLNSNKQKLCTTAFSFCVSFPVSHHFLSLSFHLFKSSLLLKPFTFSWHRLIPVALLFAHSPPCSLQPLLLLSTSLTSLP